MKQNDIFRLALQAGFKEGDLSLFPSLLTKFAALVAAVQPLVGAQPAPISPS